jgi:hypothetical protein
VRAAFDCISGIGSNTFDFVVCVEVLENVANLYNNYQLDEVQSSEFKGQGTLENINLTMIKKRLSNG